MNQEIEAIEAATKAINRIKVVGRLAEFTLSNGIVLSVKPVPPLLLNAISQEFNPPPPPKVFIEEKGREEENPNDPAYLRLCEDLVKQQELAVNDLVMAIGTKVKSVPEGYFMPEEKEWIQQVEYASQIAGKPLKIDDDSTKRYLCWLRFYAMETQSDALWCAQLPLQLVGIREGEVDEVVAFFRGVSGRGAYSNGSAAPVSENGDTTNRATRRARS